MSKPRYDWWPYVKGMIRRYPKLLAEYNELKQVKITTQFKVTPSTQEIVDPTADAALRSMSKVRQKEYDAVQKAITITQLYPNGEIKLKVIRLVYWERKCNLAGAALATHFSETTVIRWHGEFIRLVAKCFGLLE